MNKKDQPDTDSATDTRPPGDRAEGGISQSTTEQADIERELLAVSESITHHFPVTAAHTELILMDVDPTRVHAFWHIRADDLAAARTTVDPAHDQAPLTLRFHDLQPEPGDGTFSFPGFDVPVDGLDNHREVTLWDGVGNYMVELGLRLTNGHLAVLARSNRIRTAPERPASLVSAHDRTAAGLDAGGPLPAMERPASGPTPDPLRTLVDPGSPSLVPRFPVGSLSRPGATPISPSGVAATDTAAGGYPLHPDLRAPIRGPGAPPSGRSHWRSGAGRLQGSGTRPAPEPAGPEHEPAPTPGNNRNGDRSM